MNEIKAMVAALVLGSMVTSISDVRAMDSEEERKEEEFSQEVKDDGKLTEEREKWQIALCTAIEEGNSKIVRKALEYGVDLTAEDDEEHTPLIKAAGYAQLNIIGVLLRYKADINGTNKKGTTPLQAAAGQGHHEIVRVLLRERANVDQATEKGTTSLIVAAGEGHDKVVRILLQAQADIDKAQNNGATALCIASIRDRKTVVKLLLNNKATIDKAAEGTTPLLAALYKNNIQVARILLDSKADIQLKDKGGITSLMCISCHKRTEVFSKEHEKVVRILLDGKVDVNAVAQDGKSALAIASDAGHARMVELLVEARADVNGERNTGETPLISAAVNGYGVIVDILLAGNADIDMINRHGQTPLIVTLSQGLELMALALLEKKADVSKGGESIPPLVRAAQGSSIEVVKKMLEMYTCDHSAYDCCSYALLVACNRNHTAMVRMLLGKELDVNIGRKESTPLMIAVKNNNSEIVRELVFVGANIDCQDDKGSTALSLAMPELRDIMLTTRMIRSGIEEQDWLPERLLDDSLLNDFLSIFGLQKIVDEYATYYTDDETLNELVRKRIMNNEKRRNQQQCLAIEEQLSHEPVLTVRSDTLPHRAQMGHQLVENSRRLRQLVAKAGTRVSGWWQRAKKEENSVVGSHGSAANVSQECVRSSLSTIAEDAHDVAYAAENVCCAEYPECTCFT